jgi:hypothetical protein
MGPISGSINNHIQESNVYNDSVRFRAMLIAVVALGTVIGGGFSALPVALGFAAGMFIPLPQFPES